MGTGHFAAPALRTLIASDYDVCAVYTKPLTSTRRSRSKIAPNPIRDIATKNSIPIHDPHGKLSDTETFTDLSAYNADIIVVAAYGKILPQSILDIPRYGCINIHASLLPRWRGASPIHNAICSGDTETGVTIMRMDAGLDTGPIIAQQHRTIPSDIHTPQLFDLLADDGAKLLIEALPLYISGKLLPQEQDDTSATYCRTLSRDDGMIDWSMSAQEIYNRFRGLDPWPGIFTTWMRDNKKLRIKFIDIHYRPQQKHSHYIPGDIFALPEYPLCIATSDGIIIVETLQLEGKKSTDAHSFVNGYPDIYSASLAKIC